ncbi:MAG: Zn-dependent exopeptidase M28 [Anaerolineales bacterium]|nr:Zn-dependent exopeptidase M28 [Anaerolineales bacterium]
MKKIIVLVIIALAFAFTGLYVKVLAAYDAFVLARVEFSNIETIIDLPIYALLRDEQGNDYALVLAQVSQLEKSQADYEILDSNAAGAAYWLVTARKLDAEPPAFGRWVYHDGYTGVIRINRQENAFTLAWKNAGYELSPLPAKPLILNLHPAPLAVTDGYNADIAEMIAQVDAAEVYTLTGQLTGEWPTVIGGASYTIATRYSYSTTEIEKATQFAFETLQSYGITPTYHTWSNGKIINMRNVIGELPGNTAADEIVLITAHIDDLPASIPAPGADDNASGTVGVLTAAEILSQYEFERTVRFVIFTGEEQGLFGSSAYAEQAYNLGENIVYVLNLDMIAWDELGEPVVNLHTSLSTHSSYTQDLAIATAFIAVVNDYGLDEELSPEIVPDGLTQSDHSPFWNYGYPAILAIEDDGDDFNPNYHTSNDRLSALNQTYYVNFVRAAVGTVATLALPIPDEETEEFYIYLPQVINSVIN